MKKKTTKGTVAFRIIYVTLTLLASAVIAAALSLLWKALAAYEKSSPEIPMNRLLAEFDSSRDSLISSLNGKHNEFEDDSAIKGYFEKLTSGSLSYSRNGRKSSENATVYNIISDEGVIAEAEVIKSEKEIDCGFYEYKLSKVVFGEIPTFDCSVSAPGGASVFCNGKEISSVYVSETGTAYPETEHFQGLIEAAPCTVTYKITGFINEPEFTAYDKLGHPLALKDGSFSLAQSESPELSQLALEFSKAYSRYVVNDGGLSEATQYLAPDMPIYGELYGYENFWHNWHSGYDFLDVQADDPIFYSDKCVSVRVKYDHVLYGVSSSENGEQHSKADYTVYMVQLEDEWKVTDLSFN
ncbi:MAG: hypothetical protein NC394_02630 [Bacteroides sp.]|nr:hypothetical protein [Bacteroides sp.]